MQHLSEKFRFYTFTFSFLVAQYTHKKYSLRVNWTKRTNFSTNTANVMHNRICQIFHLSSFDESISLSLAAVQESRRCVVSVTTEAQFISSSSSTSSDVNSISSCGSKSHPWRLEATAGQRINISLLDFTAVSMSAADRTRDHVTCRQYGYVLEKLNKRNVSVCAGGGAELRQSHVYISDSNNAHIVQFPAASSSQSLGQNYLLRVEGMSADLMRNTHF